MAYDLLIKNGAVVDGTGAPARHTDVAVAALPRLQESLVDLQIALGDGYAHVYMLYDCNYLTYLLGTWVRERQAMPLERAVQRLTAQPADLSGIKDCGRVKAGYAADIAIFDPMTVGSSHRGERRYDLPGGASAW